MKSVTVLSFNVTVLVVVPWRSIVRTSVLVAKVVVLSTILVVVSVVLIVLPGNTMV